MVFKPADLCYNETIIIIFWEYILTFQEFGFNQKIMDAIAREGYETPSRIQADAIPVALKGRDILGCAQTGTGKTAAFALPTLQKLSERPLLPERGRRVIRALVLTPTRELAAQIYDSFRSYGRYLKLHCAVVVGGVSQTLHKDVLESGTDILIATPGRLLDYVGQRMIDLSRIEIFVLDEAARMLDMGFVHDVNRVITYLPKKRQTLFFTATIPEDVRKLANSMLINPVSIAVTPVSSTTELTTQYVYFTDRVKKTELLIYLLQHTPAMESVLVFTRTKYGADKLVRKLKQAGILALAIHGDKSQGARQNALSSFKTGKIRVLVATDIAARGINIDGLSHVVNYELPNVPETYVHRIGRTGRAGKTGEAISFCDFDEKEYLKDIEKLIRKKVIVVEDHPYPMENFEKTPPKQPTPRPGRGGQRKN